MGSSTLRFTNSAKQRNKRIFKLAVRKYSLVMRSVVVPALLSLLLIVVFAPPLGAQTPLPTADGVLANARQLFRQADFRGAAAAFRKITETQPSADAYSGLVRSLLKADDVKAADES